MGQGISAVLPYAIGVAISPIPIIAIVLVLFSPKAHANGLSFLAGWMVGLGALSAIVYVVVDALGTSTDQSASDSVSWGRVGLGLLLLAFARRQWAKRPAPGETPELPKWMGMVDELTPVKSAGAGLVLGAVNPKNLVLTAAAAAGVAQLGLSGGDAAVSLVVFTLIASLSIGGAVLYSFAGGASARAQLDDLKQWMDVHNTAVMAVLFLVFGVVVLAQGLGLLTK